MLMQIPPRQTLSPFTPQQTETLRAAMDRIVPADDYPSAWAAGVGDFLAALMIREPRFLPVYQKGLNALNAAAPMSFAALDMARQDALLAQFEADESHAHFFRLLVQQTMEGFYADPGNGGNKNGVSWEMIGFQVTL